MERRANAVFLLCGLSILSVLAGGAAAVPDGLHGPRVEKDGSLSTGQASEWACVAFGSYPQTEIVAAPSAAVDDYAVDEGDFLEDPVLHGKLARAEWNGDETEIDGVRYLRVNRDGAAGGAADREGHYRWGGGGEWHYFRFDPIRWRVIAVEGGKAFLMADRLLDCQPYHTEEGPVAWENSTIRSWLNGLAGGENAAGADWRGRGFVDRAFSEAERAAILPTRVANRPNARYRTDCGNDTEDRVFLLSNEDVFGSPSAAAHGFYAGNGKDDPAKRFRSTPYAKCRGAWWSPVRGYRGNGFWFMRTNGHTRESVTYICDFGYIYARGTIATCGDAGVLPALWIDLDKARAEPAGTVSSKDIQARASREGGEENRSDGDRIANPAVRGNPDDPGGRAVTYSMVRFGSYPQSEVLPDAAGGAADGAADPELHGRLESAAWENDECELDGRRFRRVVSAGGDGRREARYFVCEPLLWRVLEVRDGTALLLSHAAIECEPFQKDLRDVSWETCTLRSWLNGYGAEANASGTDFSGRGASFTDRAFSAEERAAILENPVRNEANYYFGMDSGKATADRIFLLAESELFVYDSAEIHGFGRRDEIPDAAKQFKPTDYAVRKGVWRDSGETGNVFWLTRTTGYTHANVVYVDEAGCMYNRGILVTCKDAAVIPALVLDLDSGAHEYAGTFSVGGGDSRSLGF